MSPPTNLDFILEEYRAIRVEVMEAVKARRQVIAFGMAALGIIINVYGNNYDELSKLPTPLLEMFCSLLCAVVIVHYIAESRRTRRASWHLYQIEKDVVGLVAGPSLSWEAKLRNGDNLYKFFKYHHFVVLLLFYIIGVISLYVAALRLDSGKKIVPYLEVPLIVVAIVGACLMMILMHIKLKPFDKP